jgi:hypothetical protein
MTGNFVSLYARKRHRVGISEALEKGLIEDSRVCLYPKLLGNAAVNFTDRAFNAK